MPQKPPYCQDPSEYPMHADCSRIYIAEAFSKDSKGAAEATAIFYNEVSAAQQNFITALKKILPEWNESKDVKA